MPPAYGAAKCAVAAVTEAVAVRHGHDGTCCKLGLPRRHPEADCGGLLCGRRGSDGPARTGRDRVSGWPPRPAQEISRAALFLAGDDACFVTGQCCAADRDRAGRDRQSAAHRVEKDQADDALARGRLPDQPRMLADGIEKLTSWTTGPLRSHDHAQSLDFKTGLVLVQGWLIVFCLLRVDRAEARNL
jgi:hypothetical protein